MGHDCVCNRPPKLPNYLCRCCHIVTFIVTLSWCHLHHCIVMSLVLSHCQCCCCCCPIVAVLVTSLSLLLSHHCCCCIIVVVASLSLSHHHHCCCRIIVVVTSLLLLLPCHYGHVRMWKGSVSKGHSPPGEHSMLSSSSFVWLITNVLSCLGIIAMYSTGMLLASKCQQTFLPNRDGQTSVERI